MKKASLIVPDQILEKMQQARDKFNTMKQPTLKWKIFRKCNLRCSYCTIWQHRINDPSSDIINAGIIGISKVIPPNWRIYLTGGELTDNLLLTETAIKKIAGFGYPIRIITNLSASIRIYRRLFDISKGHIKSVFVTRHPNLMPINDFVLKLIKLQKITSSEYELLVRQVIENNTDEINDFLITRDKLQCFDIKLHPIRLVEKKRKKIQFADYKKNIYYEEVLNIFPSSIDFHNRQGTYCPAGYEYIYVSPTLDAYKCIPYMKSKIGYLGNFLKGDVNLQLFPTLCEYETCHCVPGR